MAPSCSRSHHLMIMMSKPTKKHQSLSSTIHSTEKMLKKLTFQGTRGPSSPVSTCTRGLAKALPCVGPFTRARAFCGPRVCSLGPIEPFYCGQNPKFLKMSIKCIQMVDFLIFGTLMLPLSPLDHHNEQACKQTSKFIINCPFY